MNEPAKQQSTAVTLRYDPSEDRILAAFNAASVESRGYWLTRRLALKFIEAANAYLERMSAVASKTPVDLRGELATMEREVSLVRTQGAVSQTPPAGLERTREAAELTAEVNISAEGQGFRLRLRGSKGGESVVGCTRAELQRIMHMFEVETAKAAWRDPAAVAAPPNIPPVVKRRAN
jgi:hypothetical protein